MRNKQATSLAQILMFLVQIIGFNKNNTKTTLIGLAVIGGKKRTFFIIASIQITVLSIILQSGQ